MEKIFRQLERINPSAARSLEEGLEETLTVHRLGIGAVLRRKSATTNPIESRLSTVQRVARNVKRYGLINPILGCVACQGILRNLVEQIPENIDGLTGSQRWVLVVRVAELITIVDLFRIADITPEDLAPNWTYNFEHGDGRACHSRFQRPGHRISPHGSRRVLSDIW